MDELLFLFLIIYVNTKLILSGYLYRAFILILLTERQIYMFIFHKNNILCTISRVIS